MTQFRKDLNRLLKKEAYSSYIDLCNRGLMTFNETMTCISERICLEEDVFNAVKVDRFSMIYMTEDELKKKVEAASTDTLKEYMDWYLKRKEGDSMSLAYIVGWLTGWGLFLFIAYCLV